MRFYSNNDGENLGQKMMVEGTKSEEKNGKKWWASGFLGLDIAVNDDEQMILGAPVATVYHTLVNISVLKTEIIYGKPIFFLSKRIPDISVR